MAAASQTRSPAAAKAQLLVRRLDRLFDPERAFVHICGGSPNAFWLDSGTGGERGRFSFIGDGAGPLSAVITYDVEQRRVRIERGGEVELLEESIFDYLAGELRQRRNRSGLPFDFDCGYVGYLGYELKADCEGDAVHESAAPDAAFVFADRLIAFDHHESQTYLLALAPTAVEGEDWIEVTRLALEALPELAPPDPGDDSVEVRLRRSPARYRDDIAACKRYLTAGDSYEICLTNRIVAEPVQDSLSLYRRLRRINPAPFAAYLRFGEVAVLSSSPERFLSIDRDGRAEARPIKGTSRRGETAGEEVRLAAALGADEKSRAENVTIVDLLRNDLGRVCELGSVSVPELMRVETYETVHQLVSAVRGQLRADVEPVECIRACFPPGSMTGAPKKRTMEILDELEGDARGVYSGALGYLGLGGGCDLSVAIRTIAIEGETATVGAGGAIVVDSDPELELDELLLKAWAPIAAIRPPESHSNLTFGGLLER